MIPVLTYLYLYNTLLGRFYWEVFNTETNRTIASGYTWRESAAQKKIDRTISKNFG